MATALIVGASRGLGLGLTREFASRGYQVIATARDPETAEDLKALADPRQVEAETAAGESADVASEDDLDSMLAVSEAKTTAPAVDKPTTAGSTPATGDSAVTVRALDIDDSADVYAFTRRFKEPLDVLFVNAGISGPQRKDVTRYTDDETLAVFRTNALAPVRLAKLLKGQVDSERGVIAFMTSMMGSQELNTSGGSEMYRASKAALNSFVQSFIAELGDSGPTVLLLHPGWVKTDMGGERAPLEVEDSVRGLADVVEAARGGRKHGFLDYTGATLPW